MAISKKINLTNGVILTQAYIKIISVSGNKHECRIDVGLFVSEEYTDNKYVEIRGYSFTPNLDTASDNFIKQGYDYLKTLPEYEGAIDVLEDGQTL